MEKPVLNKQGQTEEEFLKEYAKHSYPAPYLTVDFAVFRMKDHGPEVLLIRRGNHPEIGKFAFPGGFVEKGESAREAAARELKEETGVQGLEMVPLSLYSQPGRDPRGWIVSQGYASVCESNVEASAADDAADAAWFAVHVGKSDDHCLRLSLCCGTIRLQVEAELRVNPLTGKRETVRLLQNDLAFDHGQILADAWIALARIVDSEK